ncbi:hypothetical protein GEMRC1_011223 [Eukaryota sp. GEM-RC1]
MTTTTLSVTVQNALQELANDGRSPVHKESATLAVFELRNLSRNSCSNEFATGCLLSNEVLRPFLISIHPSNHHLSTLSLSTISQLLPHFSSPTSSPLFSSLISRCISLSQSHFTDEQLPVCLLNVSMSLGTLGASLSNENLLLGCFSVLYHLSLLKSMYSNVLNSLKNLISSIFDTSFIEVQLPLLHDFFQISQEEDPQFLVYQEQKLKFSPDFGLIFLQTAFASNLKLFKNNQLLLTKVQSSICPLYIHLFRKRFQTTYLLPCLIFLLLFLLISLN